MQSIEIIEKINGSVTTSKNIADVFKKAHRNVIRDIRELECSDKFRALNFEPSFYVTSQNKKLECFEVTKDGFAFLAMGYTGKKAGQFKEAYIEEFNRLSDSMHTISDRVNALEKKKLDLDNAGREWSKIGNKIRKERKRHRIESAKIIDEVQFKLF
tara:strand:+ start:106 stop:576 length:471 start_codon:yes stop_codon:yes gene_type:complete